MDFKAPIRAVKKSILSRTPTAKVEKHVAAMLPRLACIDVGASFYPHPQWGLFRKSPQVEWIAVEPNHHNLDYARNWSWPAKLHIVETGLSEKGGEQILYRTHVESGSSLLKPVIPDGESHRYQHDYFFPVTEIKIDTLSLESVTQSFVKMLYFGIKLDTQGTELSILQGMPTEALKQQMICAELEVTTKANPAMQGAARLYEVQPFMESLGLEMVCLKSIASAPSSRSQSLGGIGVINECDSVFMMRRQEAITRGEECVRALLGFYVAYRLFDEALALLDWPGFKGSKFGVELNQLRSLLSG